MQTNPEVGDSIVAAGIRTNYHDQGKGPAVLLIHGSGPGVTAWANWRLTIPALSPHFRVVAPDMVGFGETQRPEGHRYSMQSWLAHLLGLLDALDIERAHVVGNSFGGALALALAIHAPQRVGKLVLMGSAGVSFPITEGLDAVWGYEPSIDTMRGLLDIFAFDRTRVTDELAKLRYEASIRPGYQEAFSQMFPAPRQRWVDALASPETAIRSLAHDTLIVHGRDDRVIPLDASLRLHRLIDRSQLHVFGQCGHWTQIEHAARFNRLVIDHFSEPNA
ncbi:alpha/beta fold hydrolase [Trinickia sp. NRRL B-1857]|uniref:alpha/beta fold hydrolase n=1 Tax=Trinickia sp. NRRL B-1857 TaxID=3162879 RepID=UPI003D2744D5